MLEKLRTYLIEHSAFLGSSARPSDCQCLTGRRPTFETPAVGAPAVGAPAVGAPAVGQNFPTLAALAVDASAMGALAVGAPAVSKKSLDYQSLQGG